MGHYVVTGAAGFIGSHLVDALLAAGHSVRGLDDLSTGRLQNLDPRCALIRGDVADPHVVGEAMRGADGCFHLAAIASVARTNEDWLGTHATNLTGTITVLDAARRLGGVPVVYASSAAVYGDLGPNRASEDARTVPLTAYGADKLGCELHAGIAWTVHGVPSFGLRFFNVYGPRQLPNSPYSGVISIFSQRISQGTAVTIHGDGQQRRDFVHVADVTAHLMGAMRRLRARAGAGVVNVCTGQGTSVIELLHLIAATHERVPRLVYGPARAGDIRHSVGNPTLATNVLGIAAGLSLAQGLGHLARVERAAA